MNFLSRSLLALRVTKQSLILFLGASFISFIVSNGSSLLQNVNFVTNLDSSVITSTSAPNISTTIDMDRGLDTDSLHANKIQVDDLVIANGTTKTALENDFKFDRSKQRKLVTALAKIFRAQNSSDPRNSHEKESINFRRDEFINRTCDTVNSLTNLGKDLNKHLVKSECNTVWIKSDGLPLEKRLDIFNMVTKTLVEKSFENVRIRNLSTKALVKRHFHNKAHQPGGFLTGYAKFDMFSKSQYISTVFLLPSSEIPLKNQVYFSAKDFNNNMYLHDYFPCTVSGKAAIWTTGRGNFRDTCQTNLNTLINPADHMDPRFYAYHGWAHNFRQRPKPYGEQATFSKDWNLNCPYCESVPNFVTYVHIIQNAVTMYPTANFQIDDKMKIVQLQCKNFGDGMPYYSMVSKNFLRWRTPTYKIVFSIANQWQGSRTKWNIYHTLGESFTKLSLYLPFLRENPNIAIHVQNKMPAKKMKRLFLKHFGLKNRIIYGPIFARVLIVPEGTPCFQPSYLYLQASQQILANKFQIENLKPNSILYLKRTFSRKIIEEEQVLAILGRISQRHNIRLEIFADNQVPPFSKIAEMFRRSLLTVGAHGAGLTNLIFKTPRTALFEIVCEVSPGSFIHMSHKLGLRHHAFYGGRIGIERCDGGISIKPRLAEFEQKVEQLLTIVLNDPTFARNPAML